MISMRLEISPVPFSRPGSIGKRRFNPQKYSKFRQDLSMLMRFHYGSKKPMEGPIEVRSIFYLSKPKTSKNEYPIVRPDLDNFLKGALDSANGILFYDDSQVVNVFAGKRYSEEEGIHLFVGRYKENVQAR
jgi:Holliday junction resolvase RusA-like endonuclease